MSPNPPPAKSRKPAAGKKAATPPAKSTEATRAMGTKGARPKATPKPPPRFAGLDGLRAIAVLSVVAYHLFPGTLIGGYIGVDLFFVISGFLITALLLRQKDSLGKIDLKGFWVRRARRLLPALFLLLIVICPVAAIVGGNVLIDLGRQVLGAATFSSNWLSILSEHSYFTESNPELFRNLWSLAVEEQFYLIWPLALLLLLLLPYKRLRWVLLAGAAVASGLAMALIFVPGADASRVYYGTDTHSFGLALGAALAFASQTWPTRIEDWPRLLRIGLQWAGLLGIAGVLLLAAIMADDSAFTYQGGLQLVAFLTGIAIIGSVIPGSWLGKALDNPPFKWIGERSYGLYLWHWPVFVLTVAIAPTFAASETGTWLIGGIALAASLIACAVSYRFLEQPIRKNGFRKTLASWFSGWWESFPRLAIGITVICLVAAGIQQSAIAISSAPQTDDAKEVIEAGIAALAPPEVPTVPTRVPEEASSEQLPSGSQIYAIGDSVMLAAAPALINQFPGIKIDAKVSRSMYSGPGMVRALAKSGALRPILLLGLGTNGPIDRKSLEDIRNTLGPDRLLILVSVQAPRYWTAGVNAILFQFAREYRNVEIANWRDAIAPHLDLLARDQIHAGPTGAKIYAGTVDEALQRLAELPPLLSAKEYGLAPHPS